MIGGELRADLLDPLVGGVVRASCPAGPSQRPAWRTFTRNSRSAGPIVPKLVMVQPSGSSVATVRCR